MTTFPPNLSSTYDAEADVLSISFREPPQANDTIMGENGYLYHYRDETLVGITILHASQWQKT